MDVIYVEKEKKLVKSSPLAIILIYIIVFLIGASFITLFVAKIIADKNNVSYLTLIEVISATNLDEFEDIYLSLSAKTQGISNFLAYLITLITVLIFSLEFLKEDFLKLKEKPKYYLIYILISIFGFIIITYVVELLLSFVTSDQSENQNTIEFIIENGGAVTMIIATVLLAPILEELVYRKAIFQIFKKYSLAAAYIFSIIAFTLPHVLSSDMADLGNWILITIPYLLSAFLLVLVYHKSNENIYVTILVHMANNLLAVMLILI